MSAGGGGAEEEHRVTDGIFWVSHLRRLFLLVSNPPFSARVARLQGELTSRRTYGAETLFVIVFLLNIEGKKFSKPTLRKKGEGWGTRLCELFLFKY